MSNKVRFGVRFKILLFILLVVLTSLGSFLYFALNLFTKDKNAYIYETGLSVSESIGRQIQQRLNGHISKSYGNALIGKRDVKVLQNIINSTKDLLFFASYEKNAEGVYQTKIKLTNDKIQERYKLDPAKVEQVAISLNLHQNAQLKNNNVYFHQALQKQEY